MTKTSAIENPSKAPALPAYTANKDFQFSFLMGSDFPEKHNVAWRIEIAREDAANPLLEPKYPWDSGSIASYGTVLLDPTDEELAQAKPFAEAFPELAKTIVKRGPQKTPTKKLVSLRLSPEVIDGGTPTVRAKDWVASGLKPFEASMVKV